MLIGSRWDLVGAESGVWDDDVRQAVTTEFLNLPPPSISPREPFLLFLCVNSNSVLGPFPLVTGAHS